MTVPPELRRDDGTGNGAAAEAAASGAAPSIGATLFHELCGALFEHSVDGVLLTPPDGRVLAANPAACRALGRSEEEIRRLGRGPLVVHDAAFEAFAAERERSGSARGELRCRRAHGTPFPVEEPRRGRRGLTPLRVRGAAADHRHGPLLPPGTRVTGPPSARRGRTPRGAPRP